MRGLVSLCDEVDEEELSGFALNRRYWSPAPRSPGRGTWPVVRLNALPLLEVPTHCRRVECEIGGTAEVREAAKDASVIAVRSRVGVLAFGSDLEVRRAFDPYGVTEFDLHALERGITDRTRPAARRLACRTDSRRRPRCLAGQPLGPGAGPAA